MPRGASPQREKEYEKLVDEFHEEHRYPGREEEVASRIVNKQREQHGETKDQRADDREGKSPDKSLPIKDYDRLDIDQIVPKLGHMSKSDIQAIKRYESGHNKRKTLMETIDRALDEK